jgi:hypothetical protein
MGASSKCKPFDRDKRDGLTNCDYNLYCNRNLRCRMREYRHCNRYGEPAADSCSICSPGNDLPGSFFNTYRHGSQHLYMGTGSFAFAIHRSNSNRNTGSNHYLYGNGNFSCRMRINRNSYGNREPTANGNRFGCTGSDLPGSYLYAYSRRRKHL